MKPRTVGTDVYELTWVGPVAYATQGLEPHPLDRRGPNQEEIDDILGAGGLYLVIGDHPIHGARSLLYIGQTKDFAGRILKHHRKWLSEEWRPEIYLCRIQDSQLRGDAECLLIYAHSPPYNSRNIDSFSLKKAPLRIWSVGRYWRLFPEVSSEHDWYQTK